MRTSVRSGTSALLLAALLAACGTTSTAAPDTSAPTSTSTSAPTTASPITTSVPTTVPAASQVPAGVVVASVSARPSSVPADRIGLPAGRRIEVTDPAAVAALVRAVDALPENPGTAHCVVGGTVTYAVAFADSVGADPVATYVTSCGQVVAGGPGRRSVRLGGGATLEDVCLRILEHSGAASRRLPLSHASHPRRNGRGG